MSEDLVARFSISTDKSKLDLVMIHNFLKNAYWSKNIPISIVAKSIQHSLCFGVYEIEKQVGFARVVSDYATFAYLMDVFILEPYQGQGLGKWLMTSILEHSDLQELRKWLLGTRTAHDFYRKYGFKNLTKPDLYMEISNPDMYQ